MSSPKKFLILNPFGIGDVLFTTPLISNLRKTYPDSFIGYIANQRALPVIGTNPKIDHIYLYDRDAFKEDMIRSWVKLYYEIRNEKFDAVFDLSFNPSLGVFLMACGIKKRIGYNYLRRGGLLTDKIDLRGYEGRHIVDYYLDLLKFVDVPVHSRSMEIFVDPGSKQWAKDWIKENKIDPKRPVIAIIPGGGASWGKNAGQKRWSAAGYAALVDKIIAKTGAAVILMGDHKEQQLCEELTRQCSGSLYNAVGKTTILQMAALLQLSQLAIVNDGGPLHIAVAAGVKTVGIFGPVDPVVYGPYPAQGHLVIQKNLACQPCYRQFHKASCDHLSCLRDLSVDEVFSQLPLERLL